MNEPVIVAKKLALTMGFGQDGRPAEIQILSSPNRAVLIRPGVMGFVIAKNAANGEESVTEYPFQKYFSASYVPLELEAENAGPTDASS